MTDTIFTKNTHSHSDISDMQTHSITTESMNPHNLSPYQIEAEEVYMNPKQKAHFAQLLSHWKEQLLNYVRRSLDQFQEDRPVLSDISDRASQEETVNLELRTRDRIQKLIKKIDESLSSVKGGGSYGYCEACGGEIGIRRLEARPTATLCIDCKTLAEIREKQQGNA